MSISYVEITNIFSKLKKIKNYDQLIENSIKIDGFNSSLICASDFNEVTIPYANGIRKADNNIIVPSK